MAPINEDYHQYLACFAGTASRGEWGLRPERRADIQEPSTVALRDDGPPSSSDDSTLVMGPVVKLEATRT